MNNFITNHHIAVVAPSAYVLGGVQVWLDYLITGLESKGWNVTFVLTEGKYHDTKQYLEKHPFRSFYCVKNQTGSQEGRICALASAFKKLNPDLIVNVNIVDTYLAVERIRSQGFVTSPKVVMTLHGAQADFLDDINRFRTIIDAIVVTNKLLTQLIKNFCVFETERLFYAPYGVDTVKPDIGQTSQNVLRLAYVGRFEEQQKKISDIPLILTELEKYTNHYKLVLAGSGPDEEILRSALAIFGDRVEFKGVLSQEELNTYIYQSSTALLLTSTWETGPIVAWEAMANGLVLVTSQYIGSGIEGSLHNEKNCLTFPIGDIKAAATAILRLQDPELKFNLSQAGRELVCQRYSRANSIQMWEEAIDKIMKLPPKQLPKTVQKFPPSGKLDRLLGNRLAETVRKFLGIRFEHQSAGGEWPHSYGKNANEEEFIKHLQKIENTLKQHE
ncbi:glycosyltransferase family 4 protein [Pseudanabaena mucicola]|uniref:Glycosyltransferase family 4 protein n=1 Tax=Pseudanabaena mucicola FACHB-723 TaxID=2692860 RepID=A0ABR7ZUG2_9CYAN|nr:glycosyltransferase family 4 protein [Pseudanabaena mucicola]MBD2187095.1 glycosyltransferase family 4 protein [Pseudanabaena mucicola FACHB-723]